MNERGFVRLVSGTCPVHIDFCGQEFHDRCAFILKTPARIDHALDGAQPPSMSLKLVQSSNRCANFDLLGTRLLHKVQRPPSSGE
jgi:hypothetical protein